MPVLNALADGAGHHHHGLLSDDVLHDATDCKTAYEAGKLSSI